MEETQSKKTTWQAADALPLETWSLYVTRDGFKLKVLLPQFLEYVPPHAKDIECWGRVWKAERLVVDSGFYQSL